MAVASWPQGAWRWLVTRRRVAVAAALVAIGAVLGLWLLPAKQTSAPPSLSIAWRGERSPFALSPSERDTLRRLGVNLVVVPLGEVTATGELARGTPAWGSGQLEPPIWLEVALREPPALSLAAVDRLVGALDRAWQDAAAHGWRPTGIVLDLREVATAEARARAIERLRRWRAAPASLAVWPPHATLSADAEATAGVDEYLVPGLEGAPLSPRARLRLALPVTTGVAVAAPDGRRLPVPPLDQIGRAHV